MSSLPIVFDYPSLQKKQVRKGIDFSSYNFLWEWSGNLLIERLEDIKRAFPTALSTEIKTPENILEKWVKQASIENLFRMNKFPQLKTPYAQIIGDEEQFPVANNTLDLILSNLSLHTINDLPGALIQIRRALKPDGLFLAAIPGGDTLWQLRESLNHAELSLKGGLSARVAPFIDKQQAGALLQRAGFALPVVDSEILTVTYPNIFKLMADLRGMGETNTVMSRSKKNPGKEFFHVAGKHYADHFSDPEGKIEATFEIIFLIGWAPHESQQKPLRPGSAEKSLADALQTTEISTGECP